MGKFRFPSLRCFIIPLIIILFNFIFYYLDDILDEGRTWSYLNPYGVGLATWWFNFEFFWGSFELATIKGIVIGTLLSIYTPPIFKKLDEDHQKLKDLNHTLNRNLKKTSIILGLIIGIALLFTTSSPGAGRSYNTMDMLINSWYPAYLANHFLGLIVCISGIWLIPILLYVKKQNFHIEGWTFTSSLMLIIAALLVLHMILVGTWTVNDILNLDIFIKDTAALLTIICPITIGIISVIGLYDKKNTIKLSENKKPNWVFHICFWFGINLILGIILWWSFQSVIDTMLMSIDLGIEFKSNWIPTYLFSWIYSGVLAAVIFQLSKKINYTLEQKNRKEVLN